MSASSPSEGLAKCSHCGKPAKFSCVGCKDDPLNNRFKTWYCNATCQKTHWDVHKSTCLGVRARKNIYRIGHILQNAFYTFKTVVYHGVIKKLEEKNGKLEIHFESDDKYVGKFSFPGLPCIFPFPKDIAMSHEDKVGVLSHVSCDDSLAHMNDLANFFLAECCTSIGEWRVILLQESKKRHLVSVFGGTTDPNDYMHIILKVSLVHNGGEFIIDLTGAQFGWLEPVIPFKEYMHSRVESWDVLNQYWFGFSQLEADKVMRSPEDQYTPDAFSAHVLSKTRVSILSTMETWLSQNGLTVESLMKLDHAPFQAKESDLMKNIEGSLQNRIKEVAEELSDEFELVFWEPTA